MLLFPVYRRGNGGSERKGFLKVTLQGIGRPGDHMQTSGLHIIKSHFPNILLSHFALNKKARKCTCLKPCPGFDCPLFGVLYSAFCASCYSSALTQSSSPRDRITIVFSGLYFFPKISQLLFPKYLPWSLECMKQECMKEKTKQTKKNNIGPTKSRTLHNQNQFQMKIWSLT